MSSVYSRPFVVLIARMEYHTRPWADRLLKRYKWYEKPMVNPDGQMDFPSVQLFLPDVTETLRGQLIEGTLSAKLAVSVLRDAGIPGLLDAVAEVMNAVETDEAGVLNPGLKGTLMRPADMAVQNCFPTDLSLTAHVILTMMPKACDRGRR